MPRVITQSDVDEIAPGGTLTVEADATVTPQAAERAKARGVTIRRGPGDRGGRDLMRQVTRAVVARIGNAGPQVVDAVVGEVLSALGGAPGAPAGAGSSDPVTTPRGAVLVATGNNRPGIEYCLNCVDQEKARRRSRAILTTTGRNTKGIVARITARIADLGGDILDISQTLVGDYFTMIIVVDVGAINVSFEQFRNDIHATVGEMGCQAMMMHEDVMTSLHRV